jgi:Tol biopolymer transport system component
MARTAAIAILASGTLLLGARCYFIYQREEPRAVQDAGRVSSTNTAHAAFTAGATQKQKPLVSALPMLRTAAFSPSFAASTSAMFYHSGSGRRSAIMRADMSRDNGIVRVTELVDDLAGNFHPRPSPDGRQIAFDSDRDGERGVYVANADGSGVRRVSGEGFAAVPNWSPDGRFLAIVRAERDRSRVWNIWTVDVATGAMRRVTSHRFGQPWSAAWFPDGERIAYSHEDRFVVRTLSGDSVRVFTSPIRGRLVRTPAISPDGRHVVFQVRHDGAWMLELASGRMRRILEDPSAEEFAWFADGAHVAYHSRRSGSWGLWMTSAL